MSRVRSLPTKRAKRRAATLGSHVRLHLRKAIGVVVGFSSSDRVRIRWEDTGVVTHCLKAKLELVR
jgi:hypothetical protein